MIAKVTSSIEQIKWYAQSALNGFETLDLAMAAECAQSELRALIRYCEAFDNTDNTVAVLVNGGVEPKIVLECFVGDGERRD